MLVDLAEVANSGHCHLANLIAPLILFWLAPYNILLSLAFIEE